MEKVYRHWNVKLISLQSVLTFDLLFLKLNLKTKVDKTWLWKEQIIHSFFPKAWLFCFFGLISDLDFNFSLNFLRIISKQRHNFWLNRIVLE